MSTSWSKYIVTQDVSHKTDSSITESITREREGGGVEVRDVIAIILLLVVILSAISSFISIIFYCGIGILEKLSGPKYAQATCPRCSTAVIEEYSFIKPRMWTCPYCGIKIKYEKAD